MSGKEIVDIVVATSLFGWIPIYGFFCGVAKVINAIKGNDKSSGGINVNIKNDADDNDEDDALSDPTKEHEE